MIVHLRGSFVVLTSLAIAGCDSAQRPVTTPSAGDHVAMLSAGATGSIDPSDDASDRSMSSALVDAATVQRGQFLAKRAAPRASDRAPDAGKLAESSFNGPPDAADSVDDPDVMVLVDCAEFDRVGGRPPIVVDFDEVAPNTELAAGRDGGWLDGVARRGVEFVAGTAPLIVVRGRETSLSSGYEDVRQPWMHMLAPTSGEQLLSPGGVELAAGPSPMLEDDDVMLVFDPPVCAVGFDILTPSADGMSFVDVTVLAVDGRVLHAGRLASRSRPAEPGAQWPPPSADFFGVVSGARDIAIVIVDELDDNAVCPDSNIGIDTLRFAPAPRGAAGDLDGDGVVDGADLALLRDQLGSARAWTAATRSAPAPWWLVADLDRDGDVDEQDLAALLGGIGG